MKVLIVDKDELAIRALWTAFKRRGLEVLLAESGEEAMATAARELPALIVLAADLDDGVGFQIFNLIKADVTLKRIPLFMTASQSADEPLERHSRRNSRADEYFEKPLNTALVIERAENYLGPLAPSLSSAELFTGAPTPSAPVRKPPLSDRLPPVKLPVPPSMRPQKPERQHYFSASPYEPRVGYCRAMRAHNHIAVSGTAPIAEDGSSYGKGNAYLQAQRCFELIEEAIEHLGGTIADVIRTRVYLVSAEDWEAVGKAHHERFSLIRPATSFVVVAGLLDPDWLVEIEADALVD